MTPLRVLRAHGFTGSPRQEGWRYPERHGRQRRVRFTFLALLITLHSSLFTTPALASRTIPWTPGKTVVVKLKVGQTTEIIFPASIENMTNPDPHLFSMQPLGDRIMVKALATFEPGRTFVVDEAGRTYMVQFLEAPPGEQEDDSVEISPAAFEKSTEKSPKGPDPAALRLFKALHLGRPLPGYQITDTQAVIYYEEPKVVQMRLIKVYEGPLYLGLVVEIENMSDHSIRADPQQFKIKGFVAGTILEMLLAPNEPADSVEAFKGRPKKSRGYVVVYKKAFGSEWKNTKGK